MLSLLHVFATLTLIISILSILLPEGGLRKTALMSAGLITALCCMEVFGSVAGVDFFAPEPAAVLAPTGVSAGDPNAALDVYQRLSDGQKR